jgi:uncharacterized phiE125 gp8 family phage protein
MKQKHKVHCLVSISECKNILKLDDRDDVFSEYMLLVAAYSIESYCHRALLYRKHCERVENTGAFGLPLAEYPVKRVLTVKSQNEQTGIYNISEEFEVWPLAGSLENTTYFLRTARECRGELLVEYMAGYKCDEVPPDLKNACLELAAWNYARHQNKKIGVLENKKSDGASFEKSMPGNVMQLLENYRRKTI